jgi:hypothetical protein
MQATEHRWQLAASGAWNYCWSYWNLLCIMFTRYLGWLRHLMRISHRRPKAG